MNAQVAVELAIGCGTVFLSCISTANSSGGFGAFLGATAITTNAAETVTLEANWASATAACTITGGKSTFERLGA